MHWLSGPVQKPPLRLDEAAAVSLQVMHWLSGPVQKLPLRLAEGMTKSGECVRALAVRAGVSGPFKYHSRAEWRAGDAC